MIDTAAEGAQILSVCYVATVSATIRLFLVPYAEHFRSLGWRVEAAANGASKDEVLRAAFDRLHELPLSRSIMDVPGMLRATRMLIDLLGSGSRPDIVHAHTPIAGFITRAAVRCLPAERRPAVVYTAHGFHFHRGGACATNVLFLTAERVAGRWTDRLVVINDEDEEAARRWRIVPPARLVRLPGIGINASWYSRSQLAPGEIAAAWDGLGVALSSPVFVSVGELSRNKRTGDTLAALRLMSNTNAHLVLLGPGDQVRLKALAHDLGLAKRVHFMGQVTDVRPYVGAASALVLASKREGLNRSIMEAMALEVPVVASSARGNRELVGVGGGFVVPVGDVPAFARAMDWIVDHPTEAREMGQRGRMRVLQEYDAAILTQAHETLYRATANAVSMRRR